jgi:hypothetical protein
LLRKHVSNLTDNGVGNDLRTIQQRTLLANNEEKRPMRFIIRRSWLSCHGVEACRTSRITPRGESLARAEAGGIPTGYRDFDAKMMPE